MTIELGGVANQGNCISTKQSLDLSFKLTDPYGNGTIRTTLWTLLIDCFLDFRLVDLLY